LKPPPVWTYFSPWGAVSALRVFRRFEPPLAVLSLLFVVTSLSRWCLEVQEAVRSVSTPNYGCFFQIGFPPVGRRTPRGVSVGPFRGGPRLTDRRWGGLRRLPHFRPDFDARACVWLPPVALLYTATHIRFPSLKVRRDGAVSWEGTIRIRGGHFFSGQARTGSVPLFRRLVHARHTQSET